MIQLGVKKYKKNSFFSFDNLVFTWASQNLKEKVRKCIFKRVIIQKENDRANAVERANPVAPTVDKLHI